MDLVRTAEGTAPGGCRRYTTTAVIQSHKDPCDLPAGRRNGDAMLLLLLLGHVGATAVLSHVSATAAACASLSQWTGSMCSHFCLFLMAWTMHAIKNKHQCERMLPLTVVDDTQAVAAAAAAAHCPVKAGAFSCHHCQ